MSKRRRKKNDEWVDALLALGVGFLAVHFLSKLAKGSSVETAKTCMFCGNTTTKWARMCPRCRNTFPV